MPVQKLLAKIHIAKKELGLPDEVYRKILSDECRVSSAKFLTNEQALKVIRRFKDSGWIPKSKPKKYDGEKTDAYSATPRQKRMIEVMWHELYRGNEETRHLRQFLWNHFKVSDVRFLDKDKAYDAIEALKAIKDRRKVQGARSKEQGENAEI